MPVHPDKTAARAVDACGGRYTAAEVKSRYAEGHASALFDALRAVEPVDAMTAELLQALLPFANLGVTSGPDDEPCHLPYRITRGSIRAARIACNKAMGGDQ